MARHRMADSWSSTAGTGSRLCLCLHGDAMHSLNGALIVHGVSHAAER